MPEMLSSLLYETSLSSLLMKHEGRQYCEHDFKTLYAPCCSGCGQLYYGVCE